MPEVSNVIAAARAGSAEWARTTLRERIGVVSRLRAEIASDVDFWVETVRADVGKPRLDALGGDVLATLEFARHYEKTAAQYLRPRKLKRSAMFVGNRFYETVSPMGVALVISTWNYPLQLSLVPVISALLAGNAVILKPSEHVPNTAAALSELFGKLGLPQNVVTVCEGDGSVGAALVDAKRDVVFFTGSPGVGRKIAEKCGASLIPFALELGGKDVMIVRPDANLERAARGACYGAFVNSGQACVGVKRIIVHRDVKKTFLELLKKETAQLRVSGDRDADMGPLARSQSLERLKSQIEDCVRDGGVLETPVNIEKPFFHPVIISRPPERSRIRREESFGPVVLVEDFEDDAEAVALANDSTYGLAASVWSRDISKAKSIAEGLVVGSCAINNVMMQIANPAAPFGGEKESGIGRYHAREGLLLFSRRKTVMVNKGRSPTEKNWFPFTQKTFEFLKRLIRFRHLTLKWLPLAAVLVVSIPRGSASQPRGTLVVHVASITIPKGSIRYLLFNKDAGFPGNGKGAVAGGSGSVTDTRDFTVSLKDLPYGEYAFSVYHDVNDNGKLDSNFVGIPKEPVGASNDPQGRLGPPRYKDALFVLDRASKEITVHLVHP